MSISDKIRSIVLGGALLFSGLTGALYAQDTFPGGVGEKGLQQSSENYQKEQAAKAKKAKEDEARRKQEEERRKKEAEQANNQPKGGFETDYKETDPESEEDEDDKSLECKISSFALITKSTSVFLKAAADSTDLSSLLGINLIYPSGFPLHASIILDCNYFNRGVIFSNDLQHVHCDSLTAGGSIEIGTLFKIIGEDVKKNQKLSDGFYAGFDLGMNFVFSDFSGTCLRGNLAFFLNIGGCQIQVDTGAFIESYFGLMKDKPEPGELSTDKVGGFLDSKAYIPIKINDTQFLFFKPRLNYENANLSLTEFDDLNRKRYALHGRAQKLNLVVNSSMVFDLSETSFLAIGPEFEFGYQETNREIAPIERGLPKKILKYTAGACATLTSDWFSASLGLGYDWKTFDFYGGERVKKDGIYLMLELKADFGLGGKKEEDTFTE